MIESLGRESAWAIQKIHALAFPSPWSFENFCSFLADKTIITLGAKEQGLLVGFLMGRLIEEEGEIITFAVHPLHQGKGAGKALLNNFLNFCEEKGVQQIFLEVGTNNIKAINLYESQNFKKVGLRPAYYSEEKGSYRDAYLMRWSKVGF